MVELNEFCIYLSFEFQYFQYMNIPPEKNVIQCCILISFENRVRKEVYIYSNSRILSCC